MAEVCIVIVLYDSAGVIDDCVASLPPDVELIVVDNASTDDGASRVRRSRPDATIIRSEANLGFGGGCNLGWRRATHEVVAFINPDVRLRPGALGVMTARLAAAPHGMVGPALLDESGVARRCNGRPSVLSDVVNLLPASTRWARAGWDGKLDPADRIHRDGGPVAHIEGACFVVRRADLAAIGGFDEDFFLYDEEESLALRLARLGGRAVYEPAAEVEHKGADSTSRVRGIATRNFYRSRVLLYRKRDGDARGFLAAVVLALCVLLILPVATLNSLLRRSRTLRIPYAGNVLYGIYLGVTSEPQSGLDHRPRPLI
jgi:N-acetylglucosaminyl-diphospho-decaprenol L-rhamnosyltransferase